MSNKKQVRRKPKSVNSNEVGTAIAIIIGVLIGLLLVIPFVKYIFFPLLRMLL